MFLLKAITQGHFPKLENKSFNLAPRFAGLIALLLEKSALKGLTQVLNSLLYIKFVCKLSYEDEVSPTQYSVVAPGPAVQATALDFDHHTLRRLEAGS